MTYYVIITELVFLWNLKPKKAASQMKRNLKMWLGKAKTLHFADFPKIQLSLLMGAINLANY